MPLKILSYDRDSAINYASKWAFARNPLYYDFDPIGGDCTNFTSQCLFSGSKIMNHSAVTGWYYYSVNKRSASWTSVAYFYQFLISNKSVGPYGHPVDISSTAVGDFIQLSTVEPYFHHSCIIVKKEHETQLDKIFIACHTYDAYMKPLSEYPINKMRCIKIDGIRKF